MVLRKKTVSTYKTPLNLSFSIPLKRERKQTFKKKHEHFINIA